LKKVYLTIDDSPGTQFTAWVKYGCPINYKLNFIKNEY